MPRKPRGAATKSDIVKAAHTLFVENGYHATSMRQIAAEAGVALGGIYNHFAGKDELFATVFFEYHPYREVLPALGKARGDSLEAFLSDAALQMQISLGRRPDFLKLMFIELVEFNGRHMPQLFDEIFPQVVGLLPPFLEAAGPLRPIPLPVVFRAFLGLFFSYFITELLLTDKMKESFPPDTLSQFVDIFMHGILAGDRRPFQLADHAPGA
jgi:AcrR family transcriptional regulator